MNIYMYIYSIAAALPRIATSYHLYIHTPSTPPSRLGLYTILPSPILYGVWHKQGGSVGVAVYCAMGVQ